MEDLHDGRHEPGHPGGARCPLCLAREVGRSVGPDVVSHLVAAGRELALAVGAALDAHAAAHAGAARTAADAAAGQAGRERPPSAPSDDRQPPPEEPRGGGPAHTAGEVRRLRRIPVE